MIDDLPETHEYAVDSFVMESLPELPHSIVDQDVVELNVVDLNVVHQDVIDQDMVDRDVVHQEVVDAPPAPLHQLLLAMGY